MGPVNIAGQPMQLVKGLRAKNVDARLIEYSRDGKGHEFGYKTDEVARFGKNFIKEQYELIERCLDDGTDIFHFWNRSFIYARHYGAFMGADLPLYKKAGRRVAYRFTGFDLRTKKKHIELNPYHPWQYGYDLQYDEDAQLRYIDYVKEHVDLLIVQDTEMQVFCPEARIIPRSLDLGVFGPPVFDQPASDVPVIVHGPSVKAVKGTQFVRKAVDALQARGVKFRYVEITGMQHSEAMALLRDADIVIDQLLIGWYGVFSMEAMAMAKPVICYINPYADPGNLPIVNANPDTITDVLYELIGDAQKRSEIGKQSYAYVQETHDVARVADMAIDAYSELTQSPLDRKSIDADVAYASSQLNRLVLDQAELETIKSRRQKFRQRVKDLFSGRILQLLSREYTSLSRRVRRQYNKLFG